MHWLLARDRQAETTLGSPATPLAAGATSLPLADADLLFSVGQPLFLSEADDTELEHLGVVTAATPTMLSFSLATRVAKSANAKLWRPATWLHLAAQQATPVRRDADAGIVVERSLGGDWFATAVAEPAERLELALEGLTPATEFALRAFLDLGLERGLHPFTLVHPGREIEALRLASPEYVRIERTGERRAWRLTLGVEGRGMYR